MTVLQRIGKSQEPVSAKTPELARTVYALRNRGLVTTPRKDGFWQAEITEAGLFYLEHGHHPDRPTPGTMSSIIVARAPVASRRRDVGQSPLSLAEKLIERLQHNGGTLEIENPDQETRASYRRAIHAAKQHNLVPAGFHLRHTGRNGGDLIMRLFDDAHPEETDWNRVRLGARDKVTDADALVKLLRDHPEVLAVSEALRPRALDLVKSLAEEARRRGHKLAMSKKRKARGLYVQVGTGQYPVTVKEEQDQVVREPGPEEKRRRPYAWQRVPVQYESVPTGRLRLELPQSPHGRRDRWSDSSRSLVESKVREVIKEIEHRVEAAEQAALARRQQYEEWLAEQEREKAAKRARWEAAMVQARNRAVDDYRNTTFANALDAWGRPAKSASSAPRSTKLRPTARSRGKPNACNLGSSGDTRSPTAWTRSAVHLVSPMRVSTKIQLQTTCALTSGIGVPTAPKRSITGLKPNSEHRSAMPTAKAGHMDAEVGLNGGGDSVTLAGPQLRHCALDQLTQTFDFGP
ncbi:hypothetical protein GCM10009555_024390 [Acrocarpospora macrocephala]|uniref:Uncharacterized protein n=1 Tax=Acrocarpospora macrocephala TaxID=150177 RepID=A0A5M3WUK3_9ACTN|nr:hypothetical protein [Acrocarpospora macrocephala]GES12370.1 hypothetical protein Amac_059670 [Acrocarpospora macrocephala]